MKTCASCGYENKDGAKFCAKCGTPFVEMTATAVAIKIPPVVEEEVDDPTFQMPSEQTFIEAPVPESSKKPKKPKKQKKQKEPKPVTDKKFPWGWVVLVAVFLALGGLIALYFIVGRPLIQEEITDLLDDAVGEAEIDLYHTAVTYTEVVSQDALDEALDELDLSADLYAVKGIFFEQDRILVTLEFLNTIEANYAFDIRVNKKGELILNKFEVPKLNFLVFEEDYLKSWMEESLNTLIEDSTHEFKAIQVTDGEFYFASERE